MCIHDVLGQYGRLCECMVSCSYRVAAEDQGGAVRWRGGATGGDDVGFEIIPSLVPNALGRAEEVWRPDPLSPIGWTLGAFQ